MFPYSFLANNCRSLGVAPESKNVPVIAKTDKSTKRITFFIDIKKHQSKNDFNP